MIDLHEMAEEMRELDKQFAEQFQRVPRPVEPSKFDKPLTPCELTGDGS